MLTVQENDRLTRVGAGTPMGELQRRYRHPIGAVEELDPAYNERRLHDALPAFPLEHGAATTGE